MLKLLSKLMARINAYSDRVRLLRAKKLFESKFDIDEEGFIYIKDTNHCVGSVFAEKDNRPCQHRNGTTANYDYVTCNECRSIKTDYHSDWGIAKDKWFKSVEEAKFYKREGRLPE